MGNSTTHTQTRKLRLTVIQYKWKKEDHWPNLTNVHSSSITWFDFVSRNSKFIDLMITKCTTTPWHAPFATDQNRHCGESPDPKYIGLHCYPDSDYSKLHSCVDETSQTQTPTAALDTPSSTAGPHLDMFSNSDVDIYQNPQGISQEQSSRWEAISLTHLVHKNIGRSSSLICHWTNWHGLQKSCYDCPSFEVWIEGLNPTY